MNLDIRTPAGLLFGLIGAILVVYGLISGPIYEKSLGINVNLWWGLLLVVFGVAMLRLAWRAARRKRDAAAGKPAR
jgi:putative Mn2+ efflux pump MntP